VSVVRVVVEGSICIYFIIVVGEHAKVALVIVVVFRHINDESKPE